MVKVEEPEEVIDPPHPPMDRSGLTRLASTPPPFSFDSPPPLSPGRDVDLQPPTELLELVEEEPFQPIQQEESSKEMATSDPLFDDEPLNPEPEPLTSLPLPLPRPPPPEPIDDSDQFEMAPFEADPITEKDPVAVQLLSQQLNKKSTRFGFRGSPELYSSQLDRSKPNPSRHSFPPTNFSSFPSTQSRSVTLPLSLRQPTSDSSKVSFRGLLGKK
jgi:hypothetical protein